MSGANSFVRISFATVAILALAGTEVAVPYWTGLHEWEYAAALAVLIGTLARSLVRRATTAPPASRAAAIGILALGAAALAESLLGSGTELVQQAPGTVAALPQGAGTAVFPSAGEGKIAAGRSALVVRHEDGTNLTIRPGALFYSGASALRAVPRTAAYVQVYGRGGDRLTVTQPNSPAFLSPVTLFPQTVQLAGRVVPADEFGVPARSRMLKTFLFQTAALPGLRSRGFGSGPVLLFAVDDEGGTLVHGGIAAARSGRAVSVGGLRVRAMLGTYPQLEVSSIPSPLVLWLGLAVFVAATTYELIRDVHTWVSASAGDVLDQSCGVADVHGGACG